MTCRQCKNLINEYFDGNIRVKSEIMSHIASCPRCEKYYRQMLKIDRQLKRRVDQPIPEEFHYAWRNAVQRQPRKKKFQYKFLIPALAGALCCVFVITAFATGGFTIHSQNNVMLSGAQANAESGAVVPEAAQEPTMQDTGEEATPQEEQDAEAAMDSELTESTTDSPASDIAKAESAPSSTAPPQTGSGKAYSSMMEAAPEKVQAGSTFDRQTFVQKINELGVVMQEKETSVLLKDDGTGKIDQLLKEFGLSRKNSGIDVEVVFA
ncbi:MAG: hypothetical protein VB081_07790 [Christensenella sp.]|uniref:hypothetical protein n=1 Tax=Christensenella sp. TaxID=1935934 RepID=UPI002B20A6A2|nr:hypothetical protein [Christensenella sp.]MEA5003385.1 hypothetical protein [Christensenella sp.]